MIVEITNEKEYIDMLTSEEVSAIKREIERYLGDGKVEFDELHDGYNGSAVFEKFEGEIVDMKEENGDILVYVQGKATGIFFWEKNGKEREKRDEFYTWYTIRVSRDSFESPKIVSEYNEFWLDEYWEEDYWEED